MHFCTVIALLLALWQPACQPRQQEQPTPAQPAEPITDVAVEQQPAVAVGASRTADYFPMLQGKRLGMVVNATSQLGTGHLVDSLLKAGFDVKVIFAPEHGFRGDADAGEHVKDGKDTATGLPIISLYGSHKEPTAADLAQVDLLIFDIQDVGARFYTYISTLHYVMQACAKYNKPLLVLDRPNPNGHYVDGPVLQAGYTSFVGMHPVPVVHGMTVGEYAQMINGEGWLEGGARCVLHVVTCRHYTHATLYALPVAPSPNLPNMRSIYLYPSLCFFEGTVFSEGRGTTEQFQVYGHPESGIRQYEFTPVSRPGATQPKLKGQLCYGYSFSSISADSIRAAASIDLSHLVQAYQTFPDKDRFFLPTNFIDKLYGSARLREQIQAGWTADQIRQTWQEELQAFRQKRAKYLLYPEL